MPDVQAILNQIKEIFNFVLGWIKDLVFSILDKADEEK